MYLQVLSLGLLTCLQNKQQRVHLLERIQYLESFLSVINRDTKPTWNKILADGGSVQGLDFLDDYYVEVGYSHYSDKENLLTKKKVGSSIRSRKR